MGQSVDAQEKSDSDYVTAVLRINDIIQRRQKNPLMWNNFLFRLFGDGKKHDWALNVLHSFTKKVFFYIYVHEIAIFRLFLSVGNCLALLIIANPN